MSQIRITKTLELEKVMETLKAEWVLMDEAEIAKMALNIMYQQTLEGGLTSSEQKGVSQSLKDIKKRDYIVLSDEGEIEKHFNSL